LSGCPSRMARTVSGKSDEDKSSERSSETVCLALMCCSSDDGVLKFFKQRSQTCDVISSYLGEIEDMGKAFGQSVRRPRWDELCVVGLRCWLIFGAGGLFSEHQKSGKRRRKRRKRR